MDSHHQKFIPSTYWKQILCSVDYTHNEHFTIVACTKQGDLIEFLVDTKDNSVKDTNCIDIDNSDVREMKVYFSLHDMVSVFYLLHTQSNELLIVEKISKKLKIKEKIHKVQNFEISDVNHSGSPQVSIWYSSSKEPNLVTDFSEQLVEHSHSNKPNDKLANALKIQLKMLDVKISDRQALLKEKSNLRSKMVQTVTENLNVVSLKINAIIQKIFSGKWFIIMELENMGHIPIIDLQLVMSLDHNTTSYRFFVIDSETLHIRHMTSLKKKCFCIVILDIPVLTVDKVELAGTLYYRKQAKIGRNRSLPDNEVDLNSTIKKSTAENNGNINASQDNLFFNEQCLVIPPIELHINSLVDDSFQCIGTSVSTKLSDVYCIMLTSYEYSFSISSLTSLNQVLSTQFSCSLLCVKEIPGSCFFYYSHNGFMSETLFFIDCSSSTLTVYCKNEIQRNVISILLKQIVNKVDQTTTNLTDFQAEITHCLNLLRNEMLHDTINETPEDFSKVNKKHIFDIQKILSKFQS